MFKLRRSGYRYVPTVDKKVPKCVSVEMKLVALQGDKKRRINLSYKTVNNDQRGTDSTTHLTGFPSREC